MILNFDRQFVGELDIFPKNDNGANGMASADLSNKVS